MTNHQTSAPRGPGAAGSYLAEMAAGGYDADAVGPFHLHMVPWLLARAGVRRDATVVDIGAGQGHGLIPLRRAGWTDLVAVDREELNFARFRDELGARALCCDVATEPLPLDSASVDAILSLHLIEHLHDPALLLGECARVLRPDGCLFLVTPDWRKQLREFYRDPTHVRPYDKVSIARLLRAHGFDVDVHSWKSAFGLGRLQAYRWLPRLGMIGSDLLAVARPRASASSHVPFAKSA